MADTETGRGATFDEIVAFDTPENVVFGYIVAGIGSRFLAALLDTFLIVTLQIVTNFTLLFIVSRIAGESVLDFGSNRGLSLLAAIFGLISFAFLWGYYIFFELLWNGQSPGKRLVGLRVIQQNGAPIDVAAAFIRNLVRIIDFLPLYYGVGVLTMFIDAKSRRLGDFAGGTLVVYDRGAVTLEDLAREETDLDRSLSVNPLTRAQSVPSLGGRRLQSRHITLARNYLSRQHELHNRGPLAIYLAQRLLAEMDRNVPPLDETAALTLLKQIAGYESQPANETSSERVSE